VTRKAQLDAVVRLVRTTLDDRLLGVYLYGSAVVGGLRPASDLDLFVITSRPTTAAQRRQLIDGLRPLSARDARPAGWRPIELSIVAQPDVVPWRYPPRMDFIYGEWLRAKFDTGEATPVRWANPDLAVLIAQVRLTGRPLIGLPPAELVPTVPRADIARGMKDEIHSLLKDIDTDTANVLLTLARIWYTLSTDLFASKDKAAEWAIGRLAASGRASLERARDVYLGRVHGSCLEQRAETGELPSARSAARLLVRQIEAMPPP
jgi:streptomycin 3"-adenylyltransferase